MKIRIRKPEPLSAGGAVHLLSSREGTLDDLRQLAASGRLHAILDACDTPAVPEKCAELGSERAVSLYRGSAEEMYWAIAPYLVVVDEEVLGWITRELWEEPWGIFAVADADLETMRRHFRRFLLVHAPDGEQWYFRFYDPRVLPVFLSSCTEAEQREMFGPLESYGIPQPDAPVVTLLSRTRRREAVRTIRIPGRRPEAS
jgi:hypothetical protein